MLHRHYNLSYLNTMALSSIATQAVIFDNLTQLNTLPDNLPFFVLSGGSNVLLPTKLDATVILPRTQGIDIIDDNENTITLKVQAGENWHDLVVYCTKQGWYGLENLALIPGLVGASPIQNIGAYGTQIEDVLIGVDSFDLTNRTHHYFDKQDCGFAYRQSEFKNNLKHHLITAIYIKLHKNQNLINTSYGDLAQVSYSFAQKDHLNTPTPKHVMQAVITIRQSKLPDPAVLPNCGSFFQNPIISKEQFNALIQTYPTLPSYKVDDSYVKVPAGWLIDKAGLKGGGIAPILTHINQALVLTNHAAHTATQADILASQTLICQTVFDTFGISLLREPVWVFDDGQF